MEEPRKKRSPCLDELKWVLLVLVPTKAMQRFSLLVFVFLCPENLFGAVDFIWDEHWMQVRWQNHFCQLLPSVKHLQNCKRFAFTDSWGGKGSIKLNAAAPKSCLRTSHQHLTQGIKLLICSILVLLSAGLPFLTPPGVSRVWKSDPISRNGGCAFFVHWLSFQRP